MTTPASEPLFAWTEPNHQLPAYVNLTRQGDAWKLSVRTRGQPYASVIELANAQVDSLALWLCRPELVSDEEADRAGQAIQRAILRAGSSDAALAQRPAAPASVRERIAALKPKVAGNFTSIGFEQCRAAVLRILDGETP